MRIALSIGLVVSLGACGGLATPDGDGVAGVASGAVITTPAASASTSCADATRRVAGRALTVESLGGDRLRVMAGGEALCEGSLSSVLASGILDTATPPSGSTQPAGSDPMPARGDDGEKKGGSGGTSGTGSGGGTGGGGVGGSGPAGGGDTGTSPGGEGKSDPMPADDTRRN